MNGAGRYRASLMQEMGPGEVWWFLDTQTDRYVDVTASSEPEARAIERNLNLGLSPHGFPLRGE